MSTRPETPPTGSPPVEDSLIGKKVDKYELVRVIGRGGMGKVYEALHTGIGKRVAIKFVDAELARNKDSVARFQREAEAASAVESAHIVQIFDSGSTDEGLPYLVMELLRGEDLGHKIKRCGRLDPPEAVHVIAQILRGLRRAHDAGIIHRDLKPDNIFLVDQDDHHFAKILDFGISKVQRGRDVPAHTLTREGTVLGTPYYMSPEQAQALPDVDGRADLWSVGAILYECLSGRPPHTGTTYEQVIVHICMKDVQDIRAHNPGVPEPLARVIAKALARERADRFATAREFLTALSVASEGWVSPSRPGRDLAPTSSRRNLEFLATPGGSVRPPPSGSVRPPPGGSVRPPPGGSVRPPPSLGQTPLQVAQSTQDPAAIEPTLELKSDAPSRVGWSTSRKRIKVGDRRAVAIGATVLAAVAAVAVALYVGSRPSKDAVDGATATSAQGDLEVVVALQSNAAGTRFSVEGIELPDGLLKGKKGETKTVRAEADGYEPAEQDVTLDPARSSAQILLAPAAVQAPPVHSGAEGPQNAEDLSGANQPAPAETTDRPESAGASSKPAKVPSQPPATTTSKPTARPPAPSATAVKPPATVVEPPPAQPTPTSTAAPQLQIKTE